MKAAEMLARDLVLRVCEGDGEFRRDWLVRGVWPKRTVPLAVDPGAIADLAAAIAGAATEMGAKRLLVCRTRAAFMYDRVSVLPVSSQALVELATRWGQPDDFLVCLPDGSAAVLVSAAGYAVGAGPPVFVAALGGPDVVVSRQRFTVWARETGDQRLRLVAGRYGSGSSSRHAPRRTLRPDGAERLSVLAATVRQRPILTAGLRVGRAAAGWAAVGAIVITVLSAPRASHVFPALCGALWLLLQVFALARTHTLSWAACLRMTAFGAVSAIAFVAAARLAVGAGTLVAWRPLASPAEEAVKLVPLALFWLAARNRFARLATVDYLLLGVASGAGFALAENTATALAAPGAGWHLTALLPGWSDAGMVRFPGHAVTTGLAGASIGLAVAAWSAGADPPTARRPWWRWLAWVIPPALFGLAVLDHYHYDAAASGAAVPSWISGLHSAVGNGHASRWLLVALLVTAVAVDFSAERRVADLVPPLPGVPLWTSLARAARGSEIRTRLSWSARTATGRWVRWLARVRVAISDALVAAGHEAAFLLVALRPRRRPRGVFAASLAFTRQRRELAMREARAGGRTRRDVPRREGLWTAWQRLAAVLAVGGPAVCAALAMWHSADHDHGGERHILPASGLRPADLLGTVPALHAWFSQFILVGQVLILAAGVGVLVLLASGWAAPVPLGSRRGPGRPGRLPRSLAAVPAPGHFTLGVLRLTGELLPPGTGRLLAGAPVARPYRRLPSGQPALSGPGPLAASPGPADAVQQAPRHAGAGSALDRSGWLLPPERVRRWLGHAPEFGVEPTAASAEAANPAELTTRLTEVLRGIAEAAGSARLDAVTFRNHPARAVVDRATGGAVFFTPAGEFAGCAVLTEEQLFRLITELKL